MYSPGLVTLFLFAIQGVKGQSTVVSGTLSTGPEKQGACTLTGANDFLCSNGAFCSWSTANSVFSCVGGSGEVEVPTGPPGYTCESHLDHFDCTLDSGEEALCELSGSVWVCESTSSVAGSGSSCVVHGGHTHGDCSSQCNGIDLGEYNLGLHIVALFVILVASMVGVGLPIVSSGSIGKIALSKIFFATKHFGTGVIVSTAFVHLLYHSFIMFSNACLGELHFEPAAAAISMAGVYVVFSIDFFVMRWLKGRGANRASAEDLQAADDIGCGEQKKLPELLGHSHGPVATANHEMASSQARCDVMLLEAGIIFHSIIIGVSLGASGGDQWIPLFIAIVFHQAFEGLALGSRIGALVWEPSEWWRKWTMAVAFGLITPTGIAIGIGVHASYNPNSGAALLSIGVLDAISAGVLIYVGLVEMLHHDFFSSTEAQLSDPRQTGTLKWASAFFFLLAGSLCMSVLGKWA
ncbi:ZIP zinc/iron transport family [Meredithblackwellia eburnea MCA 4105]